VWMESWAIFACLVGNNPAATQAADNLLFSGEKPPHCRRVSATPYFFVESCLNDLAVKQVEAANADGIRPAYECRLYDWP
jgi:hypothetical protein